MKIKDFDKIPGMIYEVAMIQCMRCMVSGEFVHLPGVSPKRVCREAGWRKQNGRWYCPDCGLKSGGGEQE